MEIFLPLQVGGIPQSPQQFLNIYGPAIIQFSTTLLVFLATFVIIYLISRSILVRLTEHSLKSRDFKPGVVNLATSLVAVIALIGSIAIAATVAGFGTILVAFSLVAGALALAVGFATQDLVSNFVSGVFILKDDPFKIGDWIEWNENVGVVREIQLRITKLDTFDNEMITVPNNELTNAVVKNPVAHDKLRISYGFGIGYDDDIEKAQNIITKTGNKIDGVFSDPAPSAPVKDLGDSAVVLSGRVWIDPKETSAARIRSAFVKEVKEQFDKKGIDMPYPHTQLTGEVDVMSQQS